MTEEDPHPPGAAHPPDRWEAAVSPARRRATESIRRVIDQLIRHEVGETTLDRMADELDRWVPVMERAPDRAQAIDAMKSDAYHDAPGDGQRTHHNPDCIVCGPANPAGLGLVVHRDGDGVVGRLVVDQTRRGAPGRAHGGILALAVDDLMGHVLVVCGTPAYTAKLEVEYLAASPVDEPIQLRAWLDTRNGRRLTIRADAHAGAALLLRAEGLFISVARL